MHEMQHTYCRSLTKKDTEKIVTEVDGMLDVNSVGLTGLRSKRFMQLQSQERP